MGNPRRISTILVAAGILLAAGSSCFAFKVLPASLHLEQLPGSVESYEILLLNDTDQPEILDIHLGEWLRNPDGSYDWGIPVHGARWTIPESIQAGETVQIRYRLTAAGTTQLSVIDYFEGAGWQGALTSDRPQPVSIAGTQPLVGSSDPASLFPITATRTVAPTSATGDILVKIELTCHQDCPSLTVYEVFSESVTIAPDTGGDPDWTLATVNRSNIDWIDVPETSLTLAPGEQRSLEFTIATPEDASGTTWSALFIQAAPSVSTVEGAQLVSIYRTAIKVFVTVPGTGRAAGEVTSVFVDADGGATPSVSFVFANTGNTLLTATGNVSIVDTVGSVVREAISEDLQVLPGGTRSASVDLSDAPPLPPGVYQAIVSVDYGGDHLAGGVRAFRVR